MLQFEIKTGCLKEGFTIKSHNVRVIYRYFLTDKIFLDVQAEYKFIPIMSFLHAINSPKPCRTHAITRLDSVVQG